MKTSFEKKPICEVCQKKPATSFSYFKKPPINAHTLHGRRQGLATEPEKEFYTAADLLNYKQPEKPAHWCFACSCTRETEDYYIMIEPLFRSAASVTDWLAHMHEKKWFVATDFLDCFHRFREATGSFHKC